MGKDIHNRSKKLEKYTDRYIGKLFSEDQTQVREFIDDLLSQSYSAGRIDKYMSSFVSIKRLLKIPFNKASEKDLKKFTAELEKSDYSEWTKHDLKIILKKYIQWLGKEDIIKWLKVKPVKNGKLPEEVLTEEDIKVLARVSYTSRDEAFVLSFYESGCRIGEYLPLQLKHVAFDKYGAVIRVTGKTGDRRIRLVASVQSLQKWIKEHPNKDDPECKRSS